MFSNLDCITRVPRAGFEPAIAWLKTTSPRPLDERGFPIENFNIKGYYIKACEVCIHMDIYSKTQTISDRDRELYQTLIKTLVQEPDACLRLRLFNAMLDTFGGNDGLRAELLGEQIRVSLHLECE